MHTGPTLSARKTLIAVASTPLLASSAALAMAGTPAGAVLFGGFWIMLIGAVIVWRGPPSHR